MPGLFADSMLRTNHEERRKIQDERPLGLAPGVIMTRLEELENEGWTRQFITDEPRLSEAVKEYRELGFEVLMEPINPKEMDEECSSCLMASCDQYKIIYTRRKH